jgi:hypothetical protein
MCHSDIGFHRRLWSPIQYEPRLATKLLSRKVGHSIKDLASSDRAWASGVRQNGVEKSAHHDQKLCGPEREGTDRVRES